MSKITPPHSDETFVEGDHVSVRRRDWFATAGPHPIFPGFWRIESGYTYRDSFVDRRIALGRKHAIKVLHKVAFDYWPKPFEAE